MAASRDRPIPIGTITNAYSTVRPIEGQKRSSLPDRARTKLSSPMTCGVPPMAYLVKLRYSDATIGPKTNRKKPSSHGEVHSHPAISSRARGLKRLRRSMRAGVERTRSVNGWLVNDVLQFLLGLRQRLLERFSPRPDPAEDLLHRRIEFGPAEVRRHLPWLSFEQRLGKDLVRLQLRHQPRIVEDLGPQ